MPNFLDYAAPLIGALKPSMNSSVAIYSYLKKNNLVSQD